MLTRVTPQSISGCLNYPASSTKGGHMLLLSSSISFSHVHTHTEVCHLSTCRFSLAIPAETSQRKQTVTGLPSDNYLDLLSIFREGGWRGGLRFSMHWEEGPGNTLDRSITGFTHKHIQLYTHRAKLQSTWPAGFFFFFLTRRGHIKKKSLQAEVKKPGDNK